MAPLTHELLLLLLAVCWCSCRWACGYSSGAAACAGSGPGFPVLLPEPLGFCGNVGLSCCDPAADALLRQEFQAMNVPDSDAACATIVKAILCQRCIPSPSPQPVNAATINSIPPRCVGSPTRSSSSPSTPQPQQENGVCLERLAAGNTYVGMAAHPDGSGRAFLYTQEGKIWLANVPSRGSSDGALLFLDLTSRGLMLTGLALHPEFAANGRFFVSYACDSATSPPCRAGASSPAAGNGPGRPWRFQLVVEEFTAKGGVDYGMATEVRMIFAMGLPQVDASSNKKHGEQILFRPGQGYLYLVAGHGRDEASFPFLGKIIKLDVDGIPGNDEPEIFATGISYPRGCSFDSERPSYLYCAGVDEERNEQVYLISDTAANYSAAAVSLIIGHGRPTAGEAPSIVGGIVYRGPADPSLNGRYIYIDGSSMWAAAETPASNNGLYGYASARIPNVRCSRSSPVPCGGGVVIAGSVVSLAQDNSKNVFIIATGGIYRLTPPSLCGSAPPRAPQPHKAASSWLVWAASLLGSATPFAIYFIFSRVFGRSGGEQQHATARNYYFTWNCCFAWTCCFCGNTNDETSAPPIGGQVISG